VKIIMLTRKLSTALVTASLIASAIMPVAFAQDVEISGNGTGSHNTVTSTNTDTTIVEQTNNTTANTVVNANANSGNNTANGNTGGDVSVDTGHAINETTVVVTGGDNVAGIANPCGCESALAGAAILGNGSNSKNKVTDTNSNTLVVGQSSKTKANTTVNTKANTGKNKANNNTGGGTGITTSNARNTTGVTVTGGSNTFFNSLFGVLSL
jgi:hypothetical protein